MTRPRPRQLLDREEQLGLLRWRQEHILQGVARRLKGGIDSGRAPFDVLRRLPGPRRRRRARVGRRASCWRRSRTPSSAARTRRCEPILDRLCSLYALSRVEAERGWYQEHGRLTAARSKAVIKAVNTLCAELRPDARPARRRLRRPGTRRAPRRTSRRSSTRRDAAAARRARAPGARRGEVAVRRARLRRGHDGRGRRARRRHQAAALHVLRQQGGALPRVHGAGGRGARGDRRRGRARCGDAGGRAASRRARVLRLRGSRPQRLARAVRRDAPRRRGARATGGAAARPADRPGRRGPARPCAAGAARGRASRGSRRFRQRSWAPPRRSRAGGCGPTRCPPPTQRSCSSARSSRACGSPRGRDDRPHPREWSLRSSAHGPITLEMGKEFDVAPSGRLVQRGGRRLPRLRGDEPRGARLA